LASQKRKKERRKESMNERQAGKKKSTGEIEEIVFGARVS
jgi:hypothetical protein